MCACIQCARAFSRSCQGLLPCLPLSYPHTHTHTHTHTGVSRSGHDSFLQPARTHTHSKGRSNGLFLHRGRPHPPSFRAHTPRTAHDATCRYKVVSCSMDRTVQLHELPPDALTASYGSGAHMPNEATGSAGRPGVGQCTARLCAMCLKRRCEPWASCGWCAARWFICA